MRDVGFKNTSDVKWVDSFEPAIVNSNVSTDSGAELTFGSAEVLAGVSTISSNVQSLLSLGIVEVIAATIPTSSVSGIVSLEIGGSEGLTVTNEIVTSVDAFITFGVAEGISGTSYVQSNVEPLLTLGIVELVSSTIIYTSAITGEPFYGTTYYHLANPHAQSVTSVPQLVIGRPEELSATSSIEPVVSSFIILGKEEIIFGSTLFSSEVDSELSFGVIEELSSTGDVESYGIGLITIGINELLSSTTISISVAPDVGLDIGGDEELNVSNTATSMVYTADLTLGIDEPLSASILIQSVVDNLFTIGVVEILASTFPISSTILDSSLDIGGDEHLVVSGPLVESSVSVFLSFGVTEPLSGSTHAQSDIRRGGSWSDLTIGHMELLGHTSNILSIVTHTTLDIGIVESLEHNTLISTNVDSELLVGLIEFLSSVVVSTSSTPLADLTLGIDEPLSASIDIETAASSFVLMGTTEQLTATANIEVIQNSVLTIGFIELLSSTVFSISITDSDIGIGGSEIQSGTGSAITSTYAVLTLGEDVDLSGSFHIQSNIDGIFSFGIWEMLTVVSLHNTIVDAELHLGELNELNSNPLIQSDVLATLNLGVTEDLTVTDNIISVTAVTSLFIGGGTEQLSHSVILPGFDFANGNNFDPPDHFVVSSISPNLVTGSSEELSGTTNFTHTVYDAELTIGAIEVLLSTSSAIITASAGILTTGISELLSSTTVSHSVADAELSLGAIEDLSATTDIESTTTGILIFGYIEILSGAIEAISFIRKGGQYSQLTLGVIEILEYTTPIISDVKDTSLIIGIDESLSSSYYILGNTQVDALLTTGKVEVLGSSSIIQSVTTTDLTIGTDEELSGTVIATIEGGTITGELTLGVDESLSSTTGIVSDSNAEIITGVLELMSSTVITVSDVVLDLILGVDEPFVSGCVVSSNVSVFLTMGIAEQLDSSIDIVSVVGSDLNIGVDVPLTNIDIIESIVNVTELTIGINEVLSSHPYIQPIVTANLGLGILEVLGATSVTQAHLPGDLTLGVDELLEVTELVQSYVNADLELGAATPLSATINIISSDISLLTIGKAELLATSNFSISITDATLTLGVDEELSHLEYIHSNVDSSLTLGIDTPLSHSTLITSIVENSELIVGVVELLASSSIATLSTPPAPITFGLPESVEGSTFIQSNVSLDPDMIIGIDELFSSTNGSTLSFPPAELTLGSAEELSATAHVQPNIEDVLNLGGQENLSSTIVIGHLALNTIDMVVGGPVPVTASIDIESKATGTWLYVPGNLEVLSSTINPEVVITPNLQTDNEILESTDNVITTAEASVLSTGVIEVASSTNFTISVIGSVLELGVGNILDSTQNIISNVVNAELTLGTITPLRIVDGLNIVSSVDAELILGVVELASTSLFAISITDSDLLIGHVEELSSTLDIEFGFSGFLNIPGTLEILEATQEIITTASSSQLIVGAVEISGSSLSVTSSVSALTIDIGTGEELSASILAWSVTFAAQMTIGDLTDLSATCPVVCDITGNMEKPLILESTIDVISDVNVDTLYFGEETDLSSTINVVSISTGNIIIGDVTPLSASIQTARSFAFANLTNPTIYLRSDPYSAWNHPSTNVSGQTLIINGIVQIRSYEQPPIESVVGISELTMGLPDELSSTATVQSSTNDATLYIGYTELVSHTNFSISVTDATLISPMVYLSSDIPIQSVVSDSRLTGPEYLTGTSFIESDLTGNIVDGRVELVSAEDNITTSVNVELTMGIVEPLSAICNVNPFITIPWFIYNVHLNSDEYNLWNVIRSNVSDSNLRVLNGLYTGIAEAITRIEVGELVIGHAEILSATGIVESNIVVDISMGGIVDLSSTIFAVSRTNVWMTTSDFFGKSFAQTEVWSTLTLGVAEHFESGTVNVVSVVENDGLIIGVIDFYGDNTISSEVEPLLEVVYSMYSDVIVQSNIEVDLTIGTVSELTHTNIIITNVIDSELVIGGIEELSHGGFFIESFVDGFIYIGAEYGIRSDVHAVSVINDVNLEIGDHSSLHSQSHADSLIITPYMFRGHVEELSTTNVVVVSDTFVDLLIGAVELLSSTIASHSVTDAVLNIGIITELSSTSLIDTNSSGHIVIGITEILTSTVDIASLTSLSDSMYMSIVIEGTAYNNSILTDTELIVGSQESLSASSSIISTSVAEYIGGDIEPCISTISIVSKALANLDVGYAERLSGSSISSINIYDLECFGIVEELSSSIHAQTIINTFLDIGITESLASSINLVITETSSDIVIGSIELLTSTAGPWVESNSDTLWIEIEFNEVIAIQSYIPDVELTMGEAVTLSASIVISHVCTIEPLYIGEDEILNASAVVTLEVATSITLGLYNETLSSTITITHVTGTETELDSDSVYALSRRITADLQYWYDYFVVNNKSLNKHQIQFPSKNQEYNGSFIELLFNENYDATHYRYLYREVEDRLSWPDNIRTRLMLDPDNAHYYIADGDDPEIYNLNLYNIQSHDVVMLDRLLVYRLEPDNATLVGIDYDNLDSALAKMIYIYLELKLNGDYSKYDNSAIYSLPLNTLETCYETYLTQSIFEHVSAKGT